MIDSAFSALPTVPQNIPHNNNISFADPLKKARLTAATDAQGDKGTFFLLYPLPYLPYATPPFFCASVFPRRGTLLIVPYSAPGSCNQSTPDHSTLDLLSTYGSTTLDYSRPTALALYTSVEQLAPPIIHESGLTALHVLRHPL